MFSSNQKISGRQMTRLLIYDMMGISTLIVPPVLARILGADGIFAIPAALALALPVSVLIGRMSFHDVKNHGGETDVKKGGYPLYVMQKVPPVLRSVICLFYILEGIWVAGFALYLFGDLMVRNLLKEESYWLVITVIIVLAGYGIWQGIEGRARIYELMFTILMLPLVIMLFMAAVDVNTVYWTPVFTHGFLDFAKGTGVVFCFYMIILSAFFLTPYLREDINVGRSVRRSLITTAVLDSILYLILVGVFGSATLKKLNYPVVTLMSMVKIPGGFMERGDAIMAAIWFFTLYALMNTGMFCASDLMKYVAGSVKEKNRIGLTLLPVYAVAALFYHIALLREIFFAAQMYAAVPLGILIPLVLYLAKGRRKSQCQ